MDHKYSPNEHTKYENGLLIATINDEFSSDILKYFNERKEDD